MNKFIAGMVLLFSVLLSAWTSTQGTIAERQQSVQEMKTQVLIELYAVKPNVQS